MKSVKIALFIAIPCAFVLLAFMLVGGTKADEQNVTASVTIGAVSVTLAPGSFNYGTMPFSSTKASFDVIDVSGDKNIKATVGTVVTDLDIKGAGTTAWTLDATTIGENQYVHGFGTAINATTVPASYAGLTTTYATLSDGVDGEDIVWFGLEIKTPSSGTQTQQSAVVTVLASFGG